MVDVHKLQGHDGLVNSLKNVRLSLRKAKQSHNYTYFNEIAAALRASQ
jgi:hypothetical protein